MSDALARLEILAPTGLEYWAVRAVRPRARVRKVGVGLSGWDVGARGTGAIVCGLAGGLLPALPPGTVLIPELIGTAEGAVIRCDGELRQALWQGARAIGFDPEGGPLLTAGTLVTGVARQEWAARGFVAADMETGLLAGRTDRLATVRVVLDSPERSLSERWLAPGRAISQPSLWPELLWLAWAAPRYAVRAARVAAAGVERLHAALEHP